MTNTGFSKEQTNDKLNIYFTDPLKNTDKKKQKNKKTYAQINKTHAINNLKCIFWNVCL